MKLIEMYAENMSVVKSHIEWLKSDTSNDDIALPIVVVQSKAYLYYVVLDYITYETMKYKSLCVIVQTWMNSDGTLS